ncbi:LLM class flavin-dependent oxidoreductase [Actinomycetes bacterium KLBMP 9797]
MFVPEDVVFGFGAHSGIEGGPELLRMAHQADREGLDLFSLSDHPYLGERLDAYAALGFVLGRTQRLAGFANVTNLPTRPAPMLARTVTSLSALSGGRVVLGMGAGGLWDRISDMGVPRLSPSAAVDAFEEAILLVKELSGGGPPVTFAGRHYQVNQIEPAPVPAPPVWTGSVGKKSLAATGRVADGWIPGHAADWLSERYRTSRAIIDGAAAAAGRDPREIRTVFNFPGRLTDRPLAATRDRDGRWIGGSADQWVEELTGAVLEHGASGFMLFSPSGGTPDAGSLGRWAGEVVPAVREAIAAERHQPQPSSYGA